ncbi:uncharacterized protein TRAVEDRAFT_46699 [Trametes versicolor FP-101664 SS1]|uniref:uncharacterized protein n=1 Tax=Trametes versicolor (strain FP-101664) TaxID=717944 RepID=UPI0004621385|nr:uncharacterized protein TRAVEDRAFT_46699 [Trametes versicolor FP-101664 SS1]EIW59390.1 hypothetical protein TRAVEDRAFT_46699 [Trametes versicolor FP-101664 SS1]
MSHIESLLIPLRAAKDASAVIPVPGLSLALELACSIAQKAKDIGDSHDACRSLAERAASFSLGIYNQLKEGVTDSHPVATKEHVDLLLRTLRNIEGVMERRHKMRALRFLLGYTKIAKEVGDLATRLDDANNRFMMQTGIDIMNSMDTLMSTNGRVLQHVEDSAHVGAVLISETRSIRVTVLDLAQRLSNSATFDGRFRLFAEENLDLIEPIHDVVPRQEDGQAHNFRIASPVEPSGRVIRYRAIVRAAGDLSGSQVIVHTYLETDRFVEAIKSGKLTFHPYILRILGYSRIGGPGEPSYIVTEDYHCPYEDYIRPLHGVSKLRAYLQLAAEMCMAVDYLETMGPRHLLAQSEYWTYGVQYGFEWGELVFDHRYGGRVKWARNYLMLKPANNREAFIPATYAKRMRVLDVLRSVAKASAGAVVHCWLSQVLLDLTVNIVHMPGRMSWQCWQEARDLPRYTLGAWVGRNDRGEDWTIVSTQNMKLEVVTTFPEIPQVVPWLGPSPDTSQGEHSLDQKMRMVKPFNVPESDRGEMCVDVELGTAGTKWKRYQFSCIPVGTTFLFVQVDHIMGHGDAVSKIVGSAPDLSTVGFKSIGLATEVVEYMETAATGIGVGAAQQAPPPLWFFLLQYDGSNQDVTRDPKFPRGFWSSERQPTSIPEDIIFDTTRRFEHIRKNTSARLSIWKQTIGDLAFTTQTKSYTRILGPGEDELMALKELRKQHGYYSTGSPYAGDSHDADAERFSVHDGDESDDTDSEHDEYFDASDGDSDDEPEQYFDASEGDEDPVVVRYSESTHGAQDGAKGLDFDDAEDSGYYSAEEN